jgi:2-methylcitrate dehydratase PrpD
MTFDEIAEFALGPTLVPEPALEMAATLLIDTLGVAAGGAKMEAGRLARNQAVRFLSAGASEDSATLLFDGRKASVPGAAFANATQIDNLDAHDGYHPTKGHIGCAVVPALCAFAEARPDLSGRDALATLAISYEIAARAGIALHGTVSDYHTSGAWNALGVAAIGARLRGLSKDTLRQALGIAEYHGPRSQMMREIATPTMLHDGSGMGALVGSMAVFLAESGFQGAPAVTVEAADVAPYWSDLGRNWTIMDNYIKPYPVCRWAHAALDALGVVMSSQKLTGQDIKTIEVRTFSEAAALYSGMPRTTSEAQYSLAFPLAVCLVYGKISPDHIIGDGLTDSQVIEAHNKITVREDSHHSGRFPAARWSDVTVHTNDGQTYHSGDVHARGGPEAPMELAEIEGKFYAMSGSLPPKRQGAIWSMRRHLLQGDHRFSELLTLIHPNKQA